MPTTSASSNNPVSTVDDGTLYCHSQQAGLDLEQLVHGIDCPLPDPDKLTNGVIWEIFKKCGRGNAAACPGLVKQVLQHPHIITDGALRVKIARLNKTVLAKRGAIRQAFLAEKFCAVSGIMNL